MKIKDGFKLGVGLVLAYDLYMSLRDIMRIIAKKMVIYHEKEAAKGDKASAKFLEFFGYRNNKHDIKNKIGF